MTSFMQRGQAAIQTQNHAEAIEWFSKAVAESPNDAQALACLGQSLCWQGQRKQGLEYLQQSGQRLLKKAKKNKDIRLVIQMVIQLQHWEDYEGALKLVKQAVQINKTEVSGFQFLALTYSRLNQKKLALSAGRQALKLAPDSSVLSILLATLEIADNQHEKAKRRLEKVLQNLALPPEEKFRAHKELARTLDKLAEYEQVFPHLHASANVSDQVPKIKEQDADFVPDMIETNTSGFDQELLSRWSDEQFSPDQPAPIFVIGFMRSGTTLTQEVLGTHPKIFVADETDFIPTMREELNKISHYTGTTPEQLRNIEFSSVLHLREFYWNKVHARYGDKIGQRLLLDKTTMNTIDLGLINCIFPDAKVIFVTRDPRDICLSCFMQIMIPTPSTVQLLSWQGTATFYAQIMAWWLCMKQRMSMDFIEFRYEDAIADFEDTYRKIFDFLGLDWDPAVVDFHKHAAKKFIASPSFSQVAQPLYSSSVARWRHYESEFAPISQILQPFIEEFGYGE